MDGAPLHAGVDEPIQRRWRLVRPEMATDRDADVPGPDHPRFVADD